MISQPDRFGTCTPSADACLERKAPADPQAVPSRLRILVIDDEAILRDCVANLIRIAGHEVEEASSSAEGIQRLQATPVDVVLTDLQMPGGSGWEVVRAAHSRHPGLTVLVMTGDVNALEEDGGAGALAADVLLKPFALKDLLGRLAKVQKTPRAPLDLPPADPSPTGVVK